MDRHDTQHQEYHLILSKKYAGGIDGFARYRTERIAGNCLGKVEHSFLPQGEDGFLPPTFQKAQALMRLTPFLQFGRMLAHAALAAENLHHPEPDEVHQAATQENVCPSRIRLGSGFSPLRDRGLG